MSRITQRFTSSIGGKVVVAVTGILLALFVVAHLAGNLLVFKGQDAMNAYAEGLKALGPGLWLARGGLLAVFVIHIWMAIRLNRANAAARGPAYVVKKAQRSTWASRHMVLTGLLVFAFVAMHLAHFTLGWIQPEDYAKTETLLRDGVAAQRHDVYGMMIAGFQNNALVATYLASMVILGLHLTHGIGSLFQTLGLHNRAWWPLVQRASVAIAWILAVGFMTIPLLVRIGLVGSGAAS